VDYTQKSPAILATCPGIRGLERGLEQAFLRLGWKQPNIVAYVEIEAFIAENLACEMEQGLLAPAPIWSDLKTFPYHKLRGKLDFITGGYPCQPFSIAGKRGGADDPRHLYPFLSAGIRASRPLGIFFENIRNHLNIGYENVRMDLQEMGYSVREGIYSAEEAGAVHKRDRLFILAIRTGVSLADACKFGRYNEQKEPQGIVHNKVGIVLSSEQVRNKLECRTEQSSELGNSQGWDEQRERIGESRSQIPLRGYGSYEELADCSGSGLQGHSGDEYGEGRQPRGAGVPTAKSCVSRPGEEQYDWEESRTIESGMGVSANGYNFREDFLRALGNSVYADTAEIAFLDLLQKHNYKIARR
jgi:site-specific DNA-cytosine methylase